MEWLAAGDHGVAMALRIACFEAGHATLDFTLTTAATRFSATKPILAGILTSFH